MNNVSPQLLVSVRSSAEALSALAGGAGVIDVKEPARGSLGRAEVQIMRDVAAAVGGRRPVSAALGEWADDDATIPDVDLTYVKWGLAGCRNKPAWRGQMRILLQRQQLPRFVLVAYADWECAEAPAVEEIFALASGQPGSVMLVDTFCKDALMGKPRPTLLDWLPAPWVIDLCARARQAGVKIALAGSLGSAEIQALLPARPNWFAVRGAVCGDGNRRGTVDLEKVRHLAELLAESRALSVS